MKDAKDAMDKAVSGLIRCDCGCKYWEGGKCIDCNTPLYLYPEQLKENRESIRHNLRVQG